MEPLEQGNFYHIYNRGNNKQKVFFEDENYFYFLNLVKKHLYSVAELYSYCLLKNHFHLLVRIKDDAVNPSQKFSNLFNAYTKAVNKRYNRSGNILNRTFKRKKVSNERYLRNLIVYIHLNPKNGSHKDFRKYPFSSYQALLNSNYTFLERKAVLGFFENAENFQDVHLQRQSLLKYHEEPKKEYWD